jgi:hypothetical protein
MWRIIALKGVLFEGRADGLIDSVLQVAAVSISGSAQQSVRKCILGGFLKGDEFDLGNGQALRLQQQVISTQQL